MFGKKDYVEDYDSLNYLVKKAENLSIEYLDVILLIASWGLKK